MASLYKGEYLDVSTLYIGQKIEDGFKLLRDQLSVQDNGEQLSQIARTLSDMRIGLIEGNTRTVHQIECVVARLTTANRYLKSLAPAPIIPAPTKESA